MTVRGYLCFSEQGRSVSQKNTVESSKPKKATLSKKRRASSSASSKSLANVALPYGMEDFPMMDIAEAPQVRVVCNPYHW